MADSTTPFEGFDSPNYTQVPDALFDRLLPMLKEAELKALLYIIRRTFGFKKSSDAISFKQFLTGIVKHDGEHQDYGCGIRDRTTLSKALQSLEAKGIIVSQKTPGPLGETQTTVYALRFKEGVGNSYWAGRDRPQRPVGNSYPQETSNKNGSDDSKFRRSDLVDDGTTPRGWMARE